MAVFPSHATLEGRPLPNELTSAQFGLYVASACSAPGNEDKRQKFAILVIHLERSDRGSALAGLVRAKELRDEIRRRVSDAIRTIDKFSVVGINEIICFLPGIDTQAIIALAAARMIRALDPPMLIGGKTELLRPAVGAAFFPDHGNNPETLIGAADEACFAGRMQPSRLEVYRNTGGIVHEPASIEDLRTAIQKNELEVWLQPQISCGKRDCFAAEALIRWPRPVGKPPIHAGLVAEIAENNGLMPAMTDFVVNTSLRHLKFLDEQGIHISIGINLSASVLSDPDLPRRIGQALAIWNVPAARLTLEVTESSLMHDFEGALAVMIELKKLGARLSIDDFGTGYSSLSYLRRMPLDELKIDQVFVRNIIDSASDIQITQSVIDLAHHFQLEAVAEGVETREVMDLLIGFGCDLLQGYLFSKPVTVSQLVAWWPERLVNLS